MKNAIDMATMTARMIGRLLGKSAPYVLVEVLLPGGTLYALLLYFYRRSQLKSGGSEGPGFSLSITRMVRMIREEVVFLAQPYGDLDWPRNGASDGLEVLAIVPTR